MGHQKQAKMIRRNEERQLKAWLDSVENDYMDAFLLTLNENTAFFLASTQYSTVLAELRGMVKAGGDSLLPSLLQEVNMAGRILTALNILAVKANVIGLSMSEHAPGFIPSAMEIIAGVNIATEKHDLAPLRKTLLSYGDPELSKLYTEAGTQRREIRLTPEDQWIGDQLLALVGRHQSRQAAKIIVDDLEFRNDRSSLQDSALVILKASLAEESDKGKAAFRQWAKRRIDDARTRAAHRANKASR